MSAKFSLDGSMIPRTVKRMFDGRGEERRPASETAVLSHQGRNHVVRIVNISGSGAMVIFPDVPHIGELVTLQLLDRGHVPAQVQWVRDGRIGVRFTAPIE
jgi:hypothetical protein